MLFSHSALREYIIISARALIPTYITNEEGRILACLVHCNISCLLNVLISLIPLQESEEMDIG